VAAAGDPVLEVRAAPEGKGAVVQRTVVEGLQVRKARWELRVNPAAMVSMVNKVQSQ
jgi:hypothetical protein